MDEKAENFAIYYRDVWLAYEWMLFGCLDTDCYNFLDLNGHAVRNWPDPARR